MLMGGFKKIICDINYMLLMGGLKKKKKHHNWGSIPRTHMDPSRHHRRSESSDRIRLGGGILGLGLPHQSQVVYHIYYIYIYIYYIYIYILYIYT